MRVILDVVQGPLKGRQFVFDRHESLIVGRSRFVQCPVPEDLALSRDHFLIAVDPPQCELRDLGSTNGTFVNNHRVDQRVPLRAGDVIAAGQSVFRFQLESMEELSSSEGADDEASTRRIFAREKPLVRCAGCGAAAPPNLTIPNPVGSTSTASGASSETVEWWCGACRSETTNLPQPVPYYTILRELGRGAMGVVYQAQNNISNQMVALKLIMPETATTRTAIDRFQREMSVISQLRHENIVACYEQGMTRGQFWFAMEYVAGTNLEALAKAVSGRYPVDQGCRLACQILKGLEEAHRLGFVHRDIKPENVLIAEGPGGLVAKISDFGLAKSFRGVGLSGLTFSGEMRGTIPFMPPEQMLDFKTVTPLADLYATAATLYYLLTCQYIYEDTTGGDLVHMLLEQLPIPIRQRRPDVPQALDDAIQRCLARDPKERYPDATTMRRALKPFC